ncbi:probable dual specificity protein phosphatase DDB_G0281963 [Mastacembelus armatus]|uniref:protein-tyrosine-phosphatase n=1 Tax=Mastacembelus armatus TaxID=205130 RepID=A0A3Q3KXP5_9TELE|nr:probable dual specificity protein phosphatase DDB_G0281963 [Mastacembelus armatus]XP_026181893.1 probable dual specificity protein phosphatase DDB_G0281963 [Mastacembelus armatus]XP_026181894.1 probable dual specificity protein phosphatase DDB_G0281963 [Mastacembelus armatus]
MVWSREVEAERPPLSVILPRLYLGAESDVTQDQLASLGIQYVLSVSRCSPQPSFLPCSRYLRIPIDDSLREDLLPWIPQALHFIDTAMSSGASVLVHCAAGISRSPALAVAYIMYSLGMDLDHAYRFVKERRPSISPNFNFLGQLQHFQGTLSQKASHGNLLIQQSNSHLPSINGSANQFHTSHKTNHQCDTSNSDSVDIKQDYSENFYKTQQRHSHSDGNGNQQLSLSGKLQTFHLTLNENQQNMQIACKVHAPNPYEPVISVPKATQLQLSSDSASLLEKRKSLTLSLTPLGICPPSTASSSWQESGTSTPENVHIKEIGRTPEAKTQRDTGSYRQDRDTHREWSPPHSKCSMAQVKEQGLLSLFSFTLNRLLGWGERVLLGGFFVQPVRTGHPAVPYRC